MKSIKINNIGFTYKNGSNVFKDFSLNLESPENVGNVFILMGSSGSGKTTLLKLLLGIEQIQSGSINMLPENPVIAYVPQEPVLFDHLSLEKNAKYFQFAGAYKNRFNEKIYNELVVDLGLSDVIKNAKSVSKISGGQKQRLSVLRALSINPDFLMLDEPCNGLDAEVKLSFLNKLREITDHYGLFVMYITHQKLEAQLIADHIVYLVQNKAGVVEQSVTAPVFEFIEKPPIIEAAHIFRFPDVKILPVIKKGNNTIEAARSKTDISNLWLVEDENLIIDKNTQDGIKFKVLSKSPLYGVIRNDESDTEWIISSFRLNGYNIGSEINLNFSDHVEYDPDGFLVKKK